MHQILDQILRGVSVLHNELKMVHRDIKAENVLIYEMNGQIPFIKLGDFGLSCNMNDRKQMVRKCGTPGYLAPEIIRGN